MATDPTFSNPFRPGAGHPPPYLAGREHERGEFLRLLGQDRVSANPLITGLRGVGKTVLLDDLKPLAQREGWLWAGADLSESTSVTEATMAQRVMTDVATVTSATTMSRPVRPIGFARDTELHCDRVDYDVLERIFEHTPGLVADKLKAVLKLAWQCTHAAGRRGIVFAYDEAQTLSDHADRDQYPLALLLDVFQSLQRSEIRFMLALSGLPTLFPKLIDARTYSERMFRALLLDRLGRDESRDAIVKPIEHTGSVNLSEESIDAIIDLSGGYPYFIQFICRDVYDAFVLGADSVPVAEITRRLDNDFFAGRWARATERQRQLLYAIAELESAESEFSLQEVVECSRRVLRKGFSTSHVNQMLAALAASGLIYKNRHGRYSLAVPLLARYIRRQQVDGVA